ncbi:hypothetical protein YPPY14_4575, partial [Yersinia pestis PY-14]
MFLAFSCEALDNGILVWLGIFTLEEPSLLLFTFF